MGLADLFRPKHKHSDPDVRAEAVRQLGTDDAEILAELARNDAEVVVRRVAIERLDDPVRLVEVAAHEPDAGLRRLAESRARTTLTARAESESEERALAAIQRIAQLDEGERALVDVARRAPLAEVRRAAVASLQGDRALADVARSGADAELRVQALGRIGDPEILRGVAVDESRKEIGLAVVDRLDDPDSLAHVASKGKNRSVRARASRKLASLSQGSERTPEDKRAEAERAQLCRHAESLARTDRWPGAREAMDAVERAWSQLDESAPAADGALADRFRRAARRFEERYAHEGKVALAAAARKRADRGDDAERAQPSPAGNEPDAPSPPAATPDAPAEAAPEGEVAGEAAGEAIGEDLKLDEPAESKADREAQKRKAREAEAALVAIVDEIEGHARAEADAATGTGSIKALDRALQRAQSRFRNVKGLPSTDAIKALVDRYEEGRRALLIRLRELREAEEWKRWANVAKKEALIGKSEELLRSDDDADLLPRLKELQAEWKRAGPVPREKNDVLWSQFKATCDQVYERVKAQRAARQEVEAKHLEQKQALVRRAEELAESTEWERTADEIKRLQREWKDIGPVPKKHAGPLWKRFRGACDQFFERRKPHLEKRLSDLRDNLEAKEKVVAAIEALPEGDGDGGTDWDEVDRELRRLRSEFRKIGPVPRAEMDAIGGRFRAACDRVAQRRQEAMAAKVAELHSQLDAAATRLEARLGGEAPDEGDVAADVMALRAAVRELERAKASDAAAARERADALAVRAIEASPEAFQGTDLDPDATLQKKRKLCERAEELVPEETAAPSASSPEEMAAALKAALADRALGMHRAGERPVAEVVAELRDQWKRLGPVPGGEADAIEARFRAACERAERAESAGDDAHPS